MPFTPKTFEELFDQGMSTILGEEGGVTDFAQMSTTSALLRGFTSVVSEAYADMEEGRNDSFIGTAEEEQLDRHTSSFGVFRKQGSLSVGSLIATPKLGAVSVTIPAGTKQWVLGERRYVNTTDVVLNAASAYTMVPISAVQIGKTYDLPPGTVLTDAATTLDSTWDFVVGTDGYDINGDPTGFLRGGSDREKDGELRSRFQDFINSLSSGTARAVRTAVLGVPDVESLVLKQYEPGVGWFTVYIDDGTDAPSPSLLEQVKAALDTTKALGIGYRVRAMAKQFVDLTIQVKVDPSFAAATATIVDTVREQIITLLNTYGFGESLYLSKAMEACHSVPGVLKATIFLPATDVLVDPEEAIRPGVITVTGVL